MDNIIKGDTSIGNEAYTPTFCIFTGRSCSATKTIDLLKQQLTQTDKLMQEYLNKCLNLEQKLAERPKKTNFKICRMCEQEFEQLQNQTAIAELEKVKERFNDRLDNFYLPLDHRQTLKEVFEQIDQQIQVLKTITDK